MSSSTLALSSWIKLTISHDMNRQLIIEAILDNINSFIMDVSTKYSSVVCNCVKVQWIGSKESTSIHQPINLLTLATWPVWKKKQQTHRKADGGETSTVGGETSSEWAKRRRADRNVQWRGETSCYRPVVLVSRDNIGIFSLLTNTERILMTFCGR